MAVTRKRRLRSTPPGTLQINDAVEVRSFEDGLVGSWHPAKIVAWESKQCLVKYDHLLSDDQNEHLSEYVDISYIDRDLRDSSNDCGRIRPTPPKVDLSIRLQYSMCVDAYYNEAWWEGVVFDHEDTFGEWKILFPDQGDELSISTGNLRLTRDWNEVTGGWSVRGNWLFLETIEELKPKYVAPVSIKQMWYDLRERQKFHRIMEWTFQEKAVWKDLISEVINDNLEMMADEFLSMTNLSQDLVVYDKSMCTPGYPRSSEEVDAVVPVENLYPPKNTAVMVPVPSNVQGVFEQPNTLLLSPSVQEKDCGSSSAKPVGKPLCSSRVCRTWRPLGIRAEECFSCVAEYLKLTKKDYELATKVRQHLLFLGWKVDFYKVDIHPRYRYTSPDGKYHYSLVKLCEELEGILHDKSSRGVKEINENASPSLSSDCLNTSSLEIVPVKSSRGVKEINDNASPSFSSDCLNTSALETAEFVNGRYCPEAITKYLSWDACLRKSSSKTRRVLAENAKQHLSAIGWKIWSMVKSCGKQERRYDSPERKTYYSLKTACIAVRNAAPSSSLLTNSDVQRSMVSLLEQSEESLNQKSRNSVNSKLLKRKRSYLLRDQHPTSSSQRSSKLNGTESGFANGLMNMGKCSLLRKLRSRVVPMKRKVTSDLRKKLGSSDDVNQSARILRSSKRARTVMAPGTLLHNPRTVLSWLIDKNIVLPRAKVFYRGKDNDVMAVGRVTRDGIKCGCCQNVLTLADFESHARSTYHQPAANIFLEDGRSLVKCQMQVLRNSMRSFPKDTVGRKRRNASLSANDNICSVCHYGGELLLCDKCPSAFHANCLNLHGVPDGDWFCPSCCCAICGRSEPVDNSEYLDEESAHCCDQCERLFHVSCLRGRGGLNLDGCPKGKWFCCRPCVKVYRGLQKLDRKTIPLGHDNLTWTLIKPMQYEDGDGLDETHVNIMVENHSKLSLALEVMHECFEPVKEARTSRDLVEDVIFGRKSELKRLNFTGFYTILLEKNDELVSAATLRIYGGKVAEVPLVGTRFHYRRLGLCRVLMNELEKRVAELGVERLVLPAVPNVLNTWTGSFGFSQMSPSERSEFLAYTFLDFQDTVMCHKLLKKPALTPSSIPRGCHSEAEACEIVDKHESNIELDCRSAISEVYHGAQIEGSDSVDEGPLDIPKDNDNNGGKYPSSDAMIIPPPPSDQQCSETEKSREATEKQDHPIVDNNGGKDPSSDAMIIPPPPPPSDQQCSETENSHEATEKKDHPIGDNNGGKDPSSDAMIIPPPPSDQQCSEVENSREATEKQDHPIVDMNTHKFKGEIIHYKRRKPSTTRPVPGTNYPNVEVSCR